MSNGGLVDIHTHVLPGVDDGARTIDVAVAVLERFVREGVGTLVCTPHLNASLAEAGAAPHEDHASRFAELSARAPEGMRLLRGWEIMLDLPGVDLPPEMYGLGGGCRAMLVEFQRRGFPRIATGEITRLRANGAVPVVAHPERYDGCHPDLIREWKRAGGIMQVDATMLLSRSTWGERSWELIENGLVDCLASDNHGDSRSLAQVRDYLVELGGEDHAVLLTQVNPARLLADQPLLPVPPFSRGPRLWRKVRRLFGAGA